MECAGNGRALFTPRRITQSWLLEAIDTAEWTGAPLGTILQEAGVSTAAAEVVFTGLDRGVEGDQIQFYQRSLTVDEAMRDEVLLVYAHVLYVRARDGDSNVQPVDQQWNFGGYGNNGVQRVNVVVR
jgi:DMSO/TMAO reductase YedYZ molybdopterin-dependent catalytic subunit